LRHEAWIREVAEYFQSGDDFGCLDGRPNIAHRKFGSKVQVDSFLSTTNTTNIDDLYWTLNQVTVDVVLGESGDEMRFYLSSNMPNLDHYEVEVNGQYWTTIPSSWEQHIPVGNGQFKFRAVNTVWVAGPITTVMWEHRDKNCSADLTWNTQCGKIVSSSLDYGYEDYKHPELLRLRMKYQLDSKLDNSAIDVHGLIPLVTWLKGLWIHGQPYRLPPFDAHYIIERGSRGVEQFHCVHYSISFVQCCLSLGFPARMVNLHRGISENCIPGKEPLHDPPCDEHCVVEVWSNDLNKWVVFDVDYDCHYTFAGDLLNCQEIHALLLSGRSDEVKMCAGPLTQSEMKQQTLAKRLSYYRHYSVLLRNNFLSDPTGPVSVAHLTDEQTEPILWWYGEDMVWRHHLMGPVHVAKPYKNETIVLNDGRMHTAWASSDSHTQHWIEVCWPNEVNISSVAIHWADRQGDFQTSRSYQVEVWQEEKWKVVAVVDSNTQCAWNIHDFPAVDTRKLRVLQHVGGGSTANPHIMWVRQVEVFGRDGI
jgi:hypothetical protein